MTQGSRLQLVDIRLYAYRVAITRNSVATLGGSASNSAFIYVSGLCKRRLSTSNIQSTRSQAPIALSSPQNMAFENCTTITPDCPVSATTYGYIPNLPANSILLAIFALCLLSQIGAGIYYRTYSFLVFLAIGCTFEVLGYAGRVMMHGNVWSKTAFRMQITCLILGPTFIAAGVYLSLKHIVRYLGAQYSRIPPSYYTWIFIGCDIVSILMQAAGGGIAGAADKNVDLAEAGNNLMVAGVAIQVATMGVCGLVAIDFVFRYRRGSQPKQNNDRSACRSRAHVFFATEAFAYMTVLVRCIYRLPEMSGGWGNALMRNEEEFLLLDGMMIALAILVLSAIHPGFWFSPMAGRPRARKLESQSSEVIIL